MPGWPRTPRERWCRAVEHRGTLALVSYRRIALLSGALLLVACKPGRGKMEELVPDGATGIVSVDAQAIFKSELYTKTKAFVDQNAEAKALADGLKSECGLDFETMKSYVVGFDVAGQNVVWAIDMPGIGKKAALECAAGKLPANDVKIVVSEGQGRAELDIAEGKVKGWSLGDDGLVIVTKGWVEAVEQRAKGEGKAAVDFYLKDAVALADRDRHVWFAGEVPAIAAGFLSETPAKGLLRVSGGMNVTSELDIVASAAFSDEPSAKAAKDAVQGLVDAGKAAAIEQGMPKSAVESLTFEQDGAVVRAKVKVPVADLVDATIGSFTKYMNRSKTSEARVNVAKMFDGAASYFNEERVDPTSMVATHACPNDGRTEGSAGLTPPLSVDCSSGCTPSSYGTQLWTDNKVWNALAFQVDHKHYFHYDFKWSNVPGGYGKCQFTVQAFGDLDHDGVYSTFERSATADEMGIDGAAGLYIDHESE